MIPGGYRCLVLKVEAATVFKDNIGEALTKFVFPEFVDSPGRRRVPLRGRARGD